MSKAANWLRGFFGGLIALIGASLIGWQAVLIYYLLTGRVESGEEHLPLGVAVAILVFGFLLLGAGYIISRSRIADSNRNT